MTTFKSLCEHVREHTDEKFVTWDCFGVETIEFSRIPLCIDLESETNGERQISLHDYGFGDGPEDITYYYQGTNLGEMIRKQLQPAICDVYARMMQN